MSAARWYIERSGTEFGPVTWAELQALARNGRVRPTDLVRRDGVPYWQPAHEARDVADGPETGRPDEQAQEPTDSVPQAPAPAVPAAVGDAVAEGEGDPVRTIPSAKPDESDPDDAAPPAAAAPAPVVPRAGRSARGQTGSAVLALMLGVGGLFFFGLLLGVLSVIVAVRTLREMRHVRCGGGRAVALAALLTGTSEVAILVAMLLRDFHARTGGFPGLHPSSRR